MKTSYSKKEFQGSDVDLQEFFKRIDKQTAVPNSSRVDFFSFYGIDKGLIKDEGEWKYSIPVESSQLLTGMIKAFRLAYGKDQRGHKKGSVQRYGYEPYHDYISTLLETVNNLEPYQQALIKTHTSFFNAQLMDAAIPGIMERISVFLMLLFCYGDEHDSDIFLITMEHLEKMLEELMHRKLTDKQEIDMRVEDHKLYTFEDAISSAFQILANKEYKVDNKTRQLFSDPNLVETLLNTLRKERKEVEQIAQNTEEYKGELTRRLNLAYSEYQKNNHDNIAIAERNLHYELKRVKEFWNAKSGAERWMLSTLRKYEEGIHEAVGIAKDYCGSTISVEQVKDAIKKRAQKGLRYDDWEEVHTAYHDLQLIQYYEDELNEIEERKPTTEGELDQLVHMFSLVRWEEVEEEMRFQSEAHQDTYRQLLRDYYKSVKKDERYKKLEEALMNVAAVMIPSKLADKAER